jgi:tetratricopeptide (TPR) repeat protein
LSLGRFQSSLGEAYLLRGRQEDADRTFNASLATLNVANEQTGENIDALYTLGELQYTIAEQLGDVSRNAEALAMLDAAEASLQKLISLTPKFGEAYLSLWNVYIERSSCYASENRLVDSVAELDRIAGMSGKMQELTEAPWMRAGSQAVTTLGRSLHWGRLKQIRDGGLNALTAAGKYELAGDQARRLPELTRRASDHFVAAQVLAYAATAANTDDRLAEDKRQPIVETLASDAVKQLTLAWEKGYLRRRNSAFTGLLRSNPEVADLAKVDEFGILQTRDDYVALLKRIETETPSK